MSRAYRTSGAKASRILPRIFDLEGATARGGLDPLARFLEQLGLDRKLADRFRKAKAGWSSGSLDRDAFFAGIERLHLFEDLEVEPLLSARQGVGRLPDLETLYRDLRRFEDPAVLGSLEELPKEVVVDASKGRRRALLEIGSTVETLCGRREGGEIGPDRGEPGRPSHHPLAVLARDRMSDLLIHQKLRPGNSGTATDIVFLLHRTLDIVKSDGKSREILARRGSLFECEEAKGVAERPRVGYVTGMRATRSLASVLAEFTRKARRRVEWEGEGELQVASFDFQRRARSSRPGCTRDPCGIQVQMNDRARYQARPSHS